MNHVPPSYDDNDAPPPPYSSLPHRADDPNDTIPCFLPACFPSANPHTLTTEHITSLIFETYLRHQLIYALEHVSPPVTPHIDQVIHLGLVINPPPDSQTVPEVLNMPHTAGRPDGWVDIAMIWGANGVGWQSQGAGSRGDEKRAGGGVEGHVARLSRRGIRLAVERVLAEEKGLGVIVMETEQKVMSDAKGKESGRKEIMGIEARHLEARVQIVDFVAVLRVTNEFGLYDTRKADALLIVIRIGPKVKMYASSLNDQERS